LLCDISWADTARGDYNKYNLPMAKSDEFPPSSGEPFSLEVLNNPEFAQEVDMFYDQNELQVTIYKTEGSMIGRLDFDPNDKRDYEVGNELTALAQGVKGMKNFLDKSGSEEGKQYPEVDFFIGETPRRMAEAAQILGFEIIGDSSNEDMEMVIIFAKPGDVRQHIEEFEEAGRLERLAQRAKRERDRKFKDTE